MLPIARIAAIFSILLFMALNSLAASAQDGDPKTAAGPLRLSHLEGEISFWREGAEDWVGARLNTPLAPGDAFYVGRSGDLELQMGSRAFVRADDNTQLTLVNQTADFIQFKITSGRVSFDLRTLPTGYAVEVDTPHAVFTIDHIGYYRVDVDGDVHFTTRRGGRAMMVPAGGQAMSIHPSEEIVVRGGTVAHAETYAAPELDRWDRWNYERTNDQVDPVSERYLPSGISGAYDLDHYGRWRVVEEYGPVWVPDAIQSGWVPYSSGRWIWDPYYQWTWIDDAPWGWAPFHYGRWVYLGSYWAWAPGPVVRVGVYAPALVAFFGVGSRTTLGVGIGTGGLGWVALGWGEPLVPWWGQPGFIGSPWWGGWHGPRVVNNVIIKPGTVINVTNINYRNTRVRNAVVATTREHFGRGHVRDTPLPVTQTRELTHIRGTLPVQAGPANLVAGAPRSTRPPEAVLSRPVISTRPPREATLPWRGETLRRQDPAVPEPRYVPPPERPDNGLPRPEFGTQTGAERPRPPLPPGLEQRHRETEIVPPVSRTRERSENIRTDPVVPRAIPPATSTLPRSAREVEPAPPVQQHAREPQRITPEPRGLETTPPQPRRVETAPPPPRPAPVPARVQERSGTDLPGQPANRVFRDQDGGNVEGRRPRQ